MVRALCLALAFASCDDGGGGGGGADGDIDGDTDGDIDGDTDGDIDGDADSDGEGALRILGNVRPNDACEYETAGDAAFHPSGSLDVAFGPYIAHVLVENTGSADLEVGDGWRNVWYEPSHTEMIAGEGTAARRNLLAVPVVIPGGERRIVDIDLLGDGATVYRRQFEEALARGKSPGEEECSVVVVLETTSGPALASEPWPYDLRVSLGPLVDMDPAADSPSVPGPDCCLAISRSTCEPGQNDELGPCSLCASCWPEVCNGGQSPDCGGDPLPPCE